jgi:hypothetical protein
VLSRCLVFLAFPHHPSRASLPPPRPSAEMSSQHLIPFVDVAQPLPRCPLVDVGIRTLVLSSHPQGGYSTSVSVSLHRRVVCSSSWAPCSCVVRRCGWHPYRFVVLTWFATSACALCGEVVRGGLGEISQKESEAQVVPRYRDVLRGHPTCLGPPSAPPSCIHPSSNTSPAHIPLERGGARAACRPDWRRAGVVRSGGGGGG